MIDINWAALGWVTVTTLAATVVIVTFYSLGLRLLSTGSSAATRPLAATIGAFACIAVGVAAVLYGVYLVIPLFHQ